MRRLRCTRRHVPLDRSDDYLLAWLALRQTARNADVNAWIFRGVEHEDQFMEFLEWQDGRAEPLEQEDLLSALAQLDTFAPASSSEEWEEAT